ncbi:MULTISPECIES: hypothetical protein [unclassified Acinetobacter]|uniref:hypothetical protein n=1 Tax=unclassified Acinetobacter TaxID=196816 RepID=UPI0015D0F012|nr:MULTISPECIES: hypothetical protein [unclassified Acinetobacter]UUS58801.1 hypothetical protein MST16_06510 [Acinetobacter sp. YH16040_T]UUS61975.1 hypothetical protein MST17_06680 [Acinetobacter sp. YH16056_T]
MIKKELSITELFGILSIAALTISVISNAFFYYSLDAIWIMSVLSPSFYIFEIIKVLVLSCSVIAVVGVLLDFYKFLFKQYCKSKPKKKILVSNHITEAELKEKIEQFLKKHKLLQAIFVIIVCVSGLITLYVNNFIGQTSMLWGAVLIGITLNIFTDDEVRRDKPLKFLVLTILAIFATCFSAQLKLNDIKKSPVATLKIKDVNKWYVLDSFQGNVILFNDSENKSNIKVVKFEDIDRISSTD